MSDFETTTIDNVAWIVRVMPDGRRQRIGRERDLDAMVDAICATPEFGTYEATCQAWASRAELQRKIRDAREEVTF